MGVFGFHIVHENMTGGMDWLAGNDYGRVGSAKAGHGGNIGSLELDIIGIVDMQEGELSVGGCQPLSVLPGCRVLENLQIVLGAGEHQHPREGKTFSEIGGMACALRELTGVPKLISCLKSSKQLLSLLLLQVVEMTLLG